MYLQWHSCSTEPGQVVGSSAGRCTRVVAYLSFSHICSGCWSSSWLNSSNFSLSVFFLSAEAINLLGFNGVGAFSGIYVQLNSTQRQFVSQLRGLFLLFSASWRNLICKTIRHCASCEQPVPVTSSTTGPSGPSCVTGPVHCGSLCPAWPSANVRAYHIAYCNPWQQTLTAQCGPVTALKWFSEAVFLFLRDTNGHKCRQI